ncbi:MAG: hypothetical protein K5785_07930 [Nitrosarchaeum sp.]|nr:hypothetical protein [Nitrosarchaeum sp.]
MHENLETHLKYYGISPWEIEVIYGFLNSRFTILQEEIQPDSEEFVSFLEIEIPLAFNDEFFKWFEYRRWENIKDVFKEMKRRRGSGNAIKIQMNFLGNPKIVFILDVGDKQLYDNAIEKIDFVLELLPYHLDPEKLPSDVIEISYRFDIESARWRLNLARSKDRKYSFSGDSWKEFT